LALAAQRARRAAIFYGSCVESFYFRLMADENPFEAAANAAMSRIDSQIADQTSAGGSSRKRDREEGAEDGGGGGSADPERRHPKHRGQEQVAESEPESDEAFTACAEGNLEELKRLHSTGKADVNATEPEEGDTLLGVACRFGQQIIAEWLVKHGAKVEQANSAGEAPLHECCLRGNLALVQWILPLLPKESCDVKAGNGMTPLAFACMGGFTEISKALHKAGASEKVLDVEAHSLLHLTCCNGNLDAAKWAYSVLGADSHAAKDSAGRTALHLACGQGELATVQWLHECGATLDAGDAQNNVSLHFAAAVADESACEQTAQWLIGAGASVTATNSDGNTPLHHAAQAGALTLVQKLLDAGAKSDATNSDGDSPFLLCCFGGHVKIAELLASLGQQLDAANEFGCNGLIQASAGGHTAMACWLLDKAPALIKSVDKQGMSAKDHAEGTGAEEVVDLLVERSKGKEKASA
jgi:ankyrin repeat protein